MDKNPLGRPLSLRDVARLVGCSPWTVRHKLIPQGLPYFQPRARSQLIFYEDQVVTWIRKKQRKGGIFK